MAIYVKDRHGHVHIATQQMIGRIQSGELVVCAAPTKDDVRPDNTYENRKRAAEATMLEAVPSDIKIAAPAPSPELVAGIAAQLAAEGDPLAQKRAPATLTAAQIEAEAQRIQAENEAADRELAEASRMRAQAESARQRGEVFELPEVKAAREKAEAAAQVAAGQTAVAAGFPGFPAVSGFPQVAAPGAGFPAGAPNLTFDPGQ